MDEIYGYCQRKEKNKEKKHQLWSSTFTTREPVDIERIGGNTWVNCMAMRQVYTGENNSSFFTLEHPSIGIGHIIHRNASACGANMHRFYYKQHYSGSFWTASCDYTSSLQPLNQSMGTRWFDDIYFPAEMWIGQCFTEGPPTNYVNLFNDQQEYYPSLELMEPDLYSSSLL